MRGKAYRRHKLYHKWIRRIRKWKDDEDHYYNSETGKFEQTHPTYKDCMKMKDSFFLKLKDQGTICSCPMCSGEKYNRNDFKKETTFLLKNAA